MGALLRHPATWVVVALGAIVCAVLLYLFQPWRVFTTVEVNEAVPGAAAPRQPVSREAAEPVEPVAAPKTLAEGDFISHEHETSGVAKVLELEGGERVLRIEDFHTSDGPDLRVWLSDQPVREGTDGWFNLDDGKVVELGELKGNKGNANYAIPASADLDSLTSVVIWCRRFSVSFGAATLA
ncbi:DM13 domain-containing protein [Microtetraspora sp. NBRC 13810]|uniref:DM13 domain-containing protein n=1 Tax=Microtetraspora sp. NBRC 13810 TaxID=3030990 RepID=UPI0025552D09|nr:DM13 domain-containing protein [Microtetraspora sp. NBRC 13810]